MTRRVVVTGLGLILPQGIGTEAAWRALVAGENGIGRITHFDPSPFEVQIAAEIKDFEAEAFLDKKEIRRMDRYSHLAMAAAAMALEGSGLVAEKEDGRQVGVIIGTGVGGIETHAVQYERFLEEGPNRVSPFFIPMMIANMASGLVSMRYGFKGPNYTTVSACSSGAHSLGDAYRWIKYGDAEVMVAGGAEACITPMALAGFCAMKALSRRNDAPEKACRPFDAERDGFVMGEGAGIAVLEELGRAEARGARILAEVVGYGMNADAYHMTMPSPDGQGATECMRLALEEAKLPPDAVDYINAHGTSTPYNDRTETAAIRRLFGDQADRLVISSTKSMTGHTLGAAGGVEFAVCSLSIRDGIVPPTINYEHPDPECDLDYVPNEARKRDIGVALTNSFGFGGHNACLVLRRYPYD